MEVRRKRGQKLRLLDRQSMILRAQELVERGNDTVADIAADLGVSRAVAADYKRCAYLILGSSVDGREWRAVGVAQISRKIMVLSELIEGIHMQESGVNIQSLAALHNALRQYIELRARMTGSISLVENVGSARPLVIVRSNT